MSDNFFFIIKQKTFDYFSLEELGTMAGFIRCAARVSLINGNAYVQLLSKQPISIQQAACISSKAWRDLNGVKRPPPYDYKNKPYHARHALFDKTLSRIDENSKVKKLIDFH